MNSSSELRQATIQRHIIGVLDVPQSRSTRGVNVLENDKADVSRDEFHILHPAYC